MSVSFTEVFSYSSSHCRLTHNSSFQQSVFPGNQLHKTRFTGNGHVLGGSTRVSEKDDSVNERTQEISEAMKLHILGGGKMLLKYIMQLANYSGSGYQ